MGRGVGLGVDEIGMTRSDIINHYIRPDRSLLEIGYYDGRNHERVKCANKLAVDPNPLTNKYRHMVIKATSDEFFKTNNQTFDLVFIDGLHEHEQVIRDVNNALECLNDGGYILLHDVLPEKIEHTTVPRPKPTGHWNGDVYKAWLTLRRRPDLTMFVIDADNGVGVIQKGEQTPVNAPLEFDSITKENMNIVSPSEI